MPSFRTGTVTTIISERAGLQRVEVDGQRAYVLTQLIGSVAVGDRVVMNTTAVELGLGTGGWHFVHWNLARESYDGPGGGHVMKLRYTSLQADVGVAEEHVEADPAGPLRGLPVIACFLHSQLAPVAAGFELVKRVIRPHARLAYVMTDSAALPLALSDLVHELRERGLLHTTLTVGQAFGGEIEAVNLRSALDLARQRADAVVVAPGPGVVGTGTTHGYGGLEVAGIVDTVGRAGGAPIVALRYSDVDDRERHRGISHHTRTALDQCHERAQIGLPDQAPALGTGRHWVTRVSVPDLAPMLEGLPAASMGRGLDDDPGFYAYAAAAGLLAASRVTSETP